MERKGLAMFTSPLLGSPTKDAVEGFSHSRLGHYTKAFAQYVDCVKLDGFFILRSI